MPEATCVLDGLDALAARLGALGLAAAHAAPAAPPTPGPSAVRPAVVPGIVAELAALLDEARRVEAAHVARAVAAPGSFAFDEAQAQLGAVRGALARLAREVRAALAPLLEPAEAAALERVALLAGRAPLTTRAEVEALQAARARRAGGAAAP